MKRDRKEGFLFLGNQLALDFVNTRPAQNGELVELLPDFQALLRWFRGAELLSAREATDIQKHWGESRRGQKVLQALRQFRETLREQVVDLERGAVIRRSTIQELNRLMAAHPMRERLKLTEGLASKELWFELKEPEDLFAPLAHSAAMLLSEVPRDRIRHCGHCILHFYDTSKKGTRRWCNMQLCGNRLKVAAYAARHKSLKGGIRARPPIPT